jgi:hypothetical protein
MCAGVLIGTLLTFSLRFEHEGENGEGARSLRTMAKAVGGASSAIHSPGLNIPSRAKLGRPMRLQTVSLISSGFRSRFGNDRWSVVSRSCSASDSPRHTAAFKGGLRAAKKRFLPIAETLLARHQSEYLPTFSTVSEDFGHLRAGNQSDNFRLKMITSACLAVSCDDCVEAAHRRPSASSAVLQRP